MPQFHDYDCRLSQQDYHSWGKLPFRPSRKETLTHFSNWIVHHFSKCKHIVGMSWTWTVIPLKSVGQNVKERNEYHLHKMKIFINAIIVPIIYLKQWRSFREIQYVVYEGVRRYIICLKQLSTEVTLWTKVCLREQLEKNFLHLNRKYIINKTENKKTSSLKEVPVNRINSLGSLQVCHPVLLTLLPTFTPCRISCFPTSQHREIAVFLCP